MTKDECELALALVKATFIPVSNDKRFAASMAGMAAMDSETVLTPKQRCYLLQSVFRYRRQLPKDIVALANRLTLEDHADQLMPDGGSPGVMEAGTCGNHINQLALPG